MAEQRNTQSIEDVLSSIRRLVSDGDTSPSAPGAKTVPVVDKLVLTPQFRVTEPEDPYQTIRALTEAQPATEADEEASLEDASDADVLMTELTFAEDALDTEVPSDIETDVETGFVSESAELPVAEDAPLTFEFVPAYEAELSPDAVPHAGAEEDATALLEKILDDRDEDHSAAQAAACVEAADEAAEDVDVSQVIALVTAVEPEAELPIAADLTTAKVASLDEDALEQTPPEEPVLKPTEVPAAESAHAPEVEGLSEESVAALSGALDDDAMERPLLESLAAIAKSDAFASAAPEPVAEAVDKAPTQDDWAETPDVEHVAEDNLAFVRGALEMDDKPIEDHVSSPIPFPQDKRAQAPANDPSAVPEGGYEEGEVLDEETLREIIADVVREELAGPLGERITRNVRKLVRREIRQLLASEEFD